MEMSTHIDATGTPSVTVRQSAKAFIVESGRVLLVKERHADGTVFWTFPGGGLDAGETLHDALRRELDEELLCRARLTDRLGEFWYAHRSWQNTVSRCHVYRCEVDSPVIPNAREGIFDYRWVRPTDLPPGTLFPVRYTIEAELGGTEPGPSLPSDEWDVGTNLPFRIPSSGD